MKIEWIIIGQISLSTCSCCQSKKKVTSNVSLQKLDINVMFYISMKRMVCMKCRANLKSVSLK